MSKKMSLSAPQVPKQVNKDFAPSSTVRDPLLPATVIDLKKEASIGNFLINSSIKF